MTIWKSKDELPEFDREFLEVYKDNSKIIDEFKSESNAKEYYLSTPYTFEPSFTVCRSLDDEVVKWCYIDDLLALEQRLEEAEEVIREIMNINIPACFNYNDCCDRCKTACHNKTAQEYLNKYKENE